MSELNGGTTIAGFTALHSGLGEAYLKGNLTLGGKINMAVGSSGGVTGKDGKHIIIDHDNGNVTLSATGSQLYLGYENTSNVRLYSNLVYGASTTIITTSGKLYYQGQDIDDRYVNHSDSYASFDLARVFILPKTCRK